MSQEIEMLPRIVSAQPVIYGVLKISWNDGYAGVVDLQPDISWGEVREYLRKPENFGKVSVSEYGHSIYWLNDDGYEIDFSSDTLRRDAERQANMHQLMAG